MSIQAINQFEAEWVTLSSDDDSEAPARFKIQGLDGKGQAELASHIDVNGEEIALMPGGYPILFKFGLLDWENIVDNDGGPIPFPRTGDRAQAFLPFAAQAELARLLLFRTFASAEDKKK